MKFLKTLLLFLSVIFILTTLVSAFGTKVSCDYSPVCTPVISDCGACSYQMRTTLCDGGGSEWSSCDQFFPFDFQPIGFTDGCEENSYRDYYCSGNSEIESYRILIHDDIDSDGYDECSDCDLDDPAINPGAAEVCDGIDNDCSGFVDDNLNSVSADKTDGVCFSAVKSCDGINGLIEPDYTLISNYEVIETTIDGLDNDCDGTVDEANSAPYLETPISTITVFIDEQHTFDLDNHFADIDGDILHYEFTIPAAVTYTYNNITNEITLESSSAGANTLFVMAVDEWEANSNPVLFYFNVVPLQTFTYYCDSDGDTYFSSTASGTCDGSGCEPVGCSLTSGPDCDDNNVAVHYYAMEFCDAFDNDCDGLVNENLVNMGAVNPNQAGVCAGSRNTCHENVTAWYVDYSVIVGYEETEISCDSLDNDCDFSVDENVKTTYYRDYDEDGVGLEGFNTDACAPSGVFTVLVFGDCDDTAALCIDDCGSVAYLDSDNDNYGNNAITTRACDANMADYVLEGNDCDDGNSLKYPGNLDICDGIDNDCNGVIDNDWESLVERNTKLNSNQVGVCTDSLQQCFEGSWIDWYDSTNILNYEEIELSQDTFDNDCDGQIDEDVMSVSSIIVNEDYPLSGMVLGSFDNPVNSNTALVYIYGTYYPDQSYSVLNSNSNIFLLGTVAVSGSGTYPFSFTGLDSDSNIEIYFLPDNVSVLATSVITRVTGVPEFGHVIDAPLDAAAPDGISFEFKNSYGVLLEETVTSSSLIQAIVRSRPENDIISMIMFGINDAGSFSYEDCAYTTDTIVVNI